VSVAKTFPTIPAGVRSSIVAIAIALVASGCRESPEPRPEPREGRDAPTFSYAGAGGASARVTRTTTPDGGERLRGETQVPFDAHAGRCVHEDVTLDARGRLVRAEISVAADCDRPADERMILDVASGEVHTTTGSTTVTRRVPQDAPWVYAPPAAIATPVSAWVTAKASASAPAVRQVRADSNHAALVPREQIAIETERGLTVIVGNDGADVDAAFVEQVRVADYGVTLVRVAALAAGKGRS
jgi:hypothetical protein